MLQIIKSKNNSVSLLEILSQLQGATFKWYIKDFEAVMKETFSGSIFSIEEKIMSSLEGYCINWKELLKLAGHIRQSINLYITGKDTKQNNELGIEMIDSSYWLIIYDDVLNTKKNDLFFTKNFFKLPQSEISNYLKNI